MPAQVVQLFEHGFDGFLRGLAELGDVLLSVLLPLSQVYHIVSQLLYVFNHV